jgi:hypothetical protein
MKQSSNLIDLSNTSVQKMESENFLDDSKTLLKKFTTTEQTYHQSKLNLKISLILSL